MRDKRWLVLLPVVFITYSLAYLDRANYSFGAAAGMAQELAITPSASALLGALFFLGYFFFQVPGALYAQNHSVKRLIFFGLIGWGGLATAMGLLSDITHLYAVRFLLGVVESAVLPALLILLARWFTRAERARVSSILILGNPVTLIWMSVLSGYLASELGWRWMFIVEGIPAVLWAFVWWKLVADRPSEAAWMDKAAEQKLSAQIAEEQKGIPPVPNLRAALTSPKALALSAQYFCWSAGLYGFVLWLPSILRDYGSGMVAVGWLSAAPYAVAAVVMMLVSSLSDRVLKRKIAIWPPLLLGAVCFVGSYLTGGSNFWLSFALLVAAGGCMYAPYGPFFAWLSEIFPRNVAGGAMALINSMGALGSFVGTYVVKWLNDWTGSPDISFLTMAAMLAISALITLCLADSKPVAVR
jgi:sugar phosphate permease